MVNLPWASPKALNELTIPQLLVLGEESPPGVTRLESAEDFAEMMERRAAGRAAEDRDWSRP